MKRGIFCGENGAKAREKRDEGMRKAGQRRKEGRTAAKGKRPPRKEGGANDFLGKAGTTHAGAFRR